jgi:predicted ATPase
MLNVIPDTDRFFVLTGGPGSGKTTLIKALERAGFAVSVEAGRGVIQDQTTIGGRALPWCDPAAFAELMLSWEMRSYRIAQARTGPVFFDRGVPDVVGYLRLSGLPVPPAMERAAALTRRPCCTEATPLPKPRRRGRGKRISNLRVGEFPLPSARRRMG